ncbi:hypothetical protein [Salinigranum halophilum]|uniref:hypothetical protein n=1 Tax=Salinigranum halophilum TaxID=2565931 RepID=UPI0010A87E69|nr:hypothetical protein [Salinigranum halophilum]
MSGPPGFRPPALPSPRLPAYGAARPPAVLVSGALAPRLGHLAGDVGDRREALAVHRREL